MAQRRGTVPPHHQRPLGRRKPSDWEHVAKHPFSALALATPEVVNRTLRLPSWHHEWDQGNEGACEGYGHSMMMSLLNGRRYDPDWLYHQAQLVDEYDDTPPEEGTSGRAACDVLRAQGHVRVFRGKDQSPNLQDGIASNRWATSVDQMRTGLYSGVPVAIGVNWYTAFDNPERGTGNGYWIGRGDLGTVRGGHCVCVYGASDRYQAFRVKNSWGRDYPLVLLPYDVMQRLLDEEGEAALVTDRL